MKSGLISKTFAHMFIRALFQGSSVVSMTWAAAQMVMVGSSSFKIYN